MNVNNLLEEERINMGASNESENNSNLNNTNQVVNRVYQHNNINSTNAFGSSSQGEINFEDSIEDDNTSEDDNNSLTEIIDNEINVQLEEGPAPQAYISIGSGGANDRNVEMKSSIQKTYNQVYSEFTQLVAQVLKAKVLKEKDQNFDRKEADFVFSLSLQGSTPFSYKIKIEERVFEYSIDLEKLIEDSPEKNQILEKLENLKKVVKKVTGVLPHVRRAQVGRKSTSDCPVALNRQDANFDRLFNNISNNTIKDCANYACKLFLENYILKNPQANLDAKNTVLNYAIKSIISVEQNICWQSEEIASLIQHWKNAKIPKENLLRNDAQNLQLQKEVADCAKKISDLEEMQKALSTNRLSLYIAAVFKPDYRNADSIEDQIRITLENAKIIQEHLQQEIDVQYNGEKGHLTKLKEFFVGSNENKDYAFDAAALLFSAMPTSALARSAYEKFCEEAKAQLPQTEGNRNKSLRKADGIEDALLQLAINGDGQLLRDKMKSYTSLDIKSPRFNAWQGWDLEDATLNVYQNQINQNNRDNQNDMDVLIRLKLEKLKEGNKDRYEHLRIASETNNYNQPLPPQQPPEVPSEVNNLNSLNEGLSQVNNNQTIENNLQNINPIQPVINENSVEPPIKAIFISQDLGQDNLWIRGQNGSVKVDNQGEWISLDNWSRSVELTKTGQTYFIQIKPDSENENCQVKFLLNNEKWENLEGNRKVDSDYNDLTMNLDNELNFGN